LEQALNQGLIVSLLTFDVKEVFDKVFPERLVYRLCLQGWLDNLVYWIASFITGRSVQIRLDGEGGPIIDILCGLLQELLILLSEIISCDPTSYDDIIFLIILCMIYTTVSIYFIIPFLMIHEFLYDSMQFHCINMTLY
jgi:hypothetical protein